MIKRVTAFVLTLALLPLALPLIAAAPAVPGATSAPAVAVAPAETGAGSSQIAQNDLRLLPPAVTPVRSAVHLHLALPAAAAKATAATGAGSFAGALQCNAAAAQGAPPPICEQYCCAPNEGIDCRLMTCTRCPLDDGDLYPTQAECDAACPL